MKARILLIAYWALFLSGICPAQGPNDLNEGVRFTLGPTSGTYRFAWWGRLGKTYLLKQSDDLLTWQYLPMIEVGNDGPLAYGFTSSADRLFLRLQIDTEPFNVDGDGNGVFDGYQALNAIVPNSGGLTYLQQYLQGRAPGVNNAPGRLANGGNTASLPNYGTAGAGGGGAGPQTDQAHDSSYSLAPHPASLWVTFGSHPDPDGGADITDYTTAHLQWDLGGAGAQAIAIQRRDSAGNWSNVGTASAGATEYDDESGLRASISYLYRLAITYSNGQTLMSSTAQFSVPLFKGMSLRWSSNSRWNPGFPEFVRSTPPLYYLVMTETSSMSGSDSGSTWSNSRSGQFSYTRTRAPATHSEARVGSYSYTYNSSGDDYSSSDNDSSSYQWFDQDRGKQNPTTTLQGTMTATGSSSWHNGSNSGSHSEGTDGDYLYQGTFQADDGQPRWLGNDFDLGNGTIIWNGTSSYSDHDSYSSSSSSNSSSSTNASSSADADGSWTGTRSYTSSSGGNSSYPIYGPAWSGYWGYSGWWSGSQAPTSTTRTYQYSSSSGNYQYNSSGSDVLSQPYPAATFFTDTINDLSDWTNWNDNWYGWNGYNWDWTGWNGYTYYQYGWWIAYRDHNATQDYVSLSKAQYKFQTNPSAPVTVKFFDLFIPDAEDPENPPPPRVVGSHTFSGGASGSDSAEFEVDPVTKPDAFGPESTTGHYYMVPGAQLAASGNIPDLSTPNGGFDYSSALDPQQKTSGIAVLRPPDANGEGAITGTVSLPNYGIPESTYVVNFTGGSGFTVKDANGDTITSGKQITQADIDDGTASLNFTVTANGSAGDGQQFTITLTTRDANGGSFGTDSVTFTNRVSAHRDFTIPLDEASGSRYRKIGLNGRPLGDEKPQQTAESDEEKEETYIDALTLGLRHSTTDVYVPVPGSDLTITARRDTLSEVWNMHSGLRPHERFDRPFGAGWSSNLCVHLETFWGSDGTSYTYVTDQNGARHRFINLYDDDWNGYYVPLPSDSRENGDYLTSFDGSIFTDRYGTQITFDFGISTSQSLTSDRNKQSGTEYHYYYGVSQIVDRHGNTLTYSYPDPATVKTLIPSTITLAGSPNQVLSIEQDTTGHVTKIWDPNGNRFTYGYADKPYTFNGQPFAAKTLTSVTGPDGKTTQYGYEFQVENDLTPADLTNGQPTPKLHLDVKTITDANSNIYTFGYAFDQTRWNYNTKNGYFRQTGAPRYVSSVTLPGGLGQTTLVNNSKVALKSQYDPDGKLYLTDDSQRRIEVTDAGGNGITYRFGEGAGNSQVFNVGGLYPDTPPAAVPKIVFYKTMQIDYAGGYEKFTFDPSAGLALSSVRDYSGNSTSYAYGDAYAPPASVIFPKVFPLAGMMTKYADPTSQTDALNQPKSFSYGAYRIMTGVTDEEGRHRSYQIDDAGRRRNELVHSGNAFTPVVQRTEFDYENAAFPSVVTKKTVKKLNGPTWSVDLVTQYVLDGNGRVWKEIVNPGGLALTTVTTYDRNGNKLSVTDPNGHKTGFEYDERNRLTRVVYADGSEKTIDYYPNGNKWHESDENGRVTTFTYDALNRLETQTRTATINGVLTPLVTRYGYQNAVKPKTSVVDPNGHATVMEYDGLLRLTSTTDALSKTTTYSYAGGNAGAHAFDSSGFKPTLITDPRNYQTQITYDALYRTRVKNVQYQLAPALFARTEIDCDGVGNPTQVRDPLNHATTTQFDALNRPYHVTFADNKDVWTYYTPTGLKWKVKDELGYETETRHDAAGRATLVLSPLVDDGLNPEEANRANHQKQAQTQTLYEGINLAATINPLGKRWDFEYDVRNRRIEEQQPAVVDAATGVGTRPTIYTGYDYVGNVLWVQDARGYTTETSYDEANRPLTTLAPPVPVYGSSAAVRPSTTRSYDKNGNVLTVTDANGHVTVNTYDWLNRLKTTKDAENHTVRYEYDEAGNRTSVKDGLNQETTLAYDGLNRNTRVTDFAGKATVFAYNGVNKTTRTDALNQVTNYGYDLRDRLTVVTYPGHPADNRTYGYDFAGSLRTVTEPGKGGAADVAYTYDALRRALTETSGGASHTYRYDLAGNRLGGQYGLAGGGNGRLVVSAYDALNRLITLTEDTRVSSYGYDLNGNLLTKTLPNAEIVAMAYDGLNRKFTEKGTSPQGALYNYLSLCDAAGNLRFSSEYTAGVPTRTLVLGYDTGDRLISEKAFNGSNTFLSATIHGYDAANNRTGKTVGGVTTTYSYNNLNELTGWTDTAGGSGSFTYDFNGNRGTRTMGGQTDSYGYDVENRLVSLTKNTAGGEGSYAYVYDYRTRRVGRNENGLTTNLVFSGGTSVQEYTAGALSVDYVRGSDWGGGVGGVLYSIRSGTPSFAHYNRRGDVTTRTDSAGVITWQASYEAGGKRTAEFGATSDRQKANTKEEDPSGLLNEGFRYRDLETLTFITRDPAGFVDGPNLYSYVRCNPFSKFDPLGLEETAAGAKVHRDGHHVSPVETWDNNGLSKEVQEHLDDVRLKPESGDKVPHGRSLAHDSYNARADAITKMHVADATKAGLKPGTLSGRDAKAFADELVEKLQGDKYLNRFNQMVREGKGTVPALNAMREAAFTEGILKDAGLLAREGSVIGKLGTFVKHLGVVGTAFSIFSWGADAKAEGATKATQNALKSATFYDVTVEPVGEAVTDRFNDAARGTMNDDSAIGRNINDKWKWLNE